jgi:hypothetical protein
MPMENKEIVAFIPVLVAVIGVIGVLFGAAATYVFNRKKTAAEIAKIAADVDLSKAQTRKAELEAQKQAAELTEIKKRQAGYDSSINELNEFKEEVLNNLAVFSLAGYMYGHLQHLYLAKAHNEPLHYEQIGDNVKRELEFLADNGYIEHINFRELTPQDNLAQRLSITPAGEWLVELREEKEGRPIPKKNPVPIAQ